MFLHSLLSVLSAQIGAVQTIIAFIEFQNVGKTYGTGDVTIHALHDASFTVEKGELVVDITMLSACLVDYFFFLC